MDTRNFNISTCDLFLIGLVVLVGFNVSLFAEEKAVEKKKDAPVKEDKKEAVAKETPKETEAGADKAGKEEPKSEGEAAEEEATDTVDEEMTVVATRAARPTFDVPNQVSVIGADEIGGRLSASQNFVNAFKETPGIHVQKTAAGQGSPFIRGQTGYRNLLMIDGVRFNNSVFRSGPIQYWATVDPLFIDHIDVMRGPGSTLYGSDAIGGTVNVRTKSTDTWSDKTEWGGMAYYRWASAERSNIGHVEFKGSHKDKVGWIFGGSFKDHDDFVAGGGTGVNPHTGYQEYSLNGKVEYQPADGHKLTFYVDKANQDNVPRTHRTTSSKPFQGTAVGSDVRRYFDQNRLLSYVKYNLTGVEKIIQEAEVTLSYQNTLQDRFRLRPNGQTRFEGLEVNTYGAQFQLKSESIIGNLTYGADFYRDDIHSYNKRYNPDSVEIQGPVGDDGYYSLFGAYIQTEKDLFDRYVTVTAGGRFESIIANAGKVEDPTVGDAIKFESDWTSLVGSIRFVVRPDLNHGDHWRWFATLNQSFRAPSFHDLTSFDTSSVLELPSPGLDPEEYTTFETGFKTRYWDLPIGEFYATASWYYTWAHGQMIRNPTGGFAVGGEVEVIKETSGVGHVQGAELSLRYKFWDDYTFWGNATFTEGNIRQVDPSDNLKYQKPWDRAIPFMSHFGFKYEPFGKKWWVEAHADAFTKADRLAFTNRTDNRIPPGGTPGFVVVGIRGGAKFLDDRLTISGGVKNLGNLEYRIHGSGQNMPGTNFVLSAKFEW